MRVTCHVTSECCRFQSEPTKCLEYRSDPDKAKEDEDAAKRKHSVTFAEAECKVREFVPDKEMVMIEDFCWNFQSCSNLI